MQILLVDDDPLVRESIGSCLRELGHSVQECVDGAAGLKAYQQSPFPMVLSDLRMPEMNGIALTRAIKKLPEGKNSDVVLLTGYGDMNSAVEALRAGAYDYVVKPVSMMELASLTDRIAEHQALLHENRRLTENFQTEVASATEETRQELARLQAMVRCSADRNNVIFRSENMQQALRQAQIYHQDRSVPVVIYGETGTGKEILARMIHDGDNADPSPFVDINCAAIPAHLFEAELFGYEGGSYTGAAAKGSKGKLDLAAGGSLFLDEFTEMPLEVQAKFLRVLERKEFYRIGGLRKIPMDTRIICASNSDLLQQVAEGKFREDLYYRLHVGHIRLLPLRERPEDILPLAEHYLLRYAREKKKHFLKISPGAAANLLRQPWPGNVRELKNLMEWAVLMFDGPELTERHITAYEQSARIGAHHSSPAAPVIDPTGFDLPDQPFSLDTYNEAIVAKTLEKTNGNKTEAALFLGISRQTLYTLIERMKKHRQL